MNKIVDLTAREILDSRGNPTIEVDCVLETGKVGRAAVPSGASTGTNEARELRDGDPRRYHGKGVLKAVANVREHIWPKLKDVEAVDQSAVDNKLRRVDLTGNKSHLGANAILGVSIAVCRAAASSLGVALYAHLGGDKESLLPVPLLNVINGGAHAPNRLDFQEYMIVPVAAKSFVEAMRCASEVYHTLRKLLLRRGRPVTVGDEGGFAPDFQTNEEPLELIVEAIGRSGYAPGQDVFIALDVAASELLGKDGRYHLAIENRSLSAQEMTRLYQTWVDEYPIISIEDGLAEEDWDGWKYLTEQLGKRVQLVGDDIFVTNRSRLEMGIERGVGNAVLIKPNQIGTVTETLECIELAKKHKYRTVISHRSGETEDTFIADLAVATSAGQVKAGAPCRTDRLAKYNQLVRIEQEVKGKFAGAAVYQR
jgi:enolase